MLILLPAIKTINRLQKDMELQGVQVFSWGRFPSEITVSIFTVLITGDREARDPANQQSKNLSNELPEHVNDNSFE